MIAFIDHKILPWDYERLPLEFAVWLPPIATTVDAIRHPQGHQDAGE